jgi:hypothetical protein
MTAEPPARAGEVVGFIDLQPFTHTAYIPAGADLSSIKIEGVKAVRVVANRRLVTNSRYCDQPWAEPGGSMYCARAEDEAPVSAYQVSYSYKGPPMASDEYGNTHFTFSVYFSPDKISPELRGALDSGGIERTAAAEFFELTTSRDSVQITVTDQTNSTFCDGNYVDGNWTHTNPKCQDNVAYMVVASPSAYITVKVDPSSRLETAKAERRSWR